MSLLGLSHSYNIFRQEYWFGRVDARPLALFRILFAAILIKDALYHLFLARDFYSDAGIVPRSALLDGLARSARFSLMDGIGSEVGAGLFFIFWALVGIGLLLGWRTRLMVVLNFVCIVSIHERNIYILNGADTVLRVLSFWILFLPLGRYYSLDAARLREKWDSEEASRTCFALPLRAIQLQIALVYLFTYLFKLPGDLWQNGQAIYHVLQLQSFTHFTGDWFVVIMPLPLLQAMTYFVLAVEGTFIVLVFSPVFQPALRILGLLGGALMHLGIALLMAVPNFSIVMMLSYSLFFDPRWVLWLEKRLRKSLFLADAPPPENPSANRSLRDWFLGVIVTFMLFNVIAWNLSFTYSAGQPLATISTFQHQLVQYVGLWQVWDMFAPNPTRLDGWIEVIGELEDGTILDLRTGAPPTHERVRYFFGPTARWKKFEDNMKTGPWQILSAWGDSFCRSYALDLPEGRRLARLQIFYRFRHTHFPTDPPAEFTDDLKWKHWCDADYRF